MQVTLNKDVKNEGPYVIAGLQRFIRKTKKPRNKDELVSGIKEYWFSHVTHAVCNTYIGHLMKVIIIVMKKNGAASGK